MYMIMITIDYYYYKGIYRAQDRPRATSALCQQRKCLLCTHCQNS